MTSTSQSDMSQTSQNQIDKPATSGTYSSVAEMVADVSTDSAFAKDFADHLSKRNISHYLFGLRSANGVSQKEIAERMNCSQSRISKLESGCDDDWRLGDLKSYLKAIGHDLSLFIAKAHHWKLMDQVKFHVCSTHACLVRLVELAKDDPKMVEGVTVAHIETFVNFIRSFADSAKRLPDIPIPEPLPEIIEAEDSMCDEPDLPRQSAVRARTAASV